MARAGCIFLAQPGFQSTGLTAVDFTTRAFSAGCWMKISAGADNNQLGLWSTYSAGNISREGIAWRQDPRVLGRNRLRFFSHTDVSTSSVFVTDVTLGYGWHHYAVVWDNNRIKFWRDRKLVGYTDASTLLTPTAGTAFGARTAGINDSGGATNGGIYLWDVQIYPGIVLSDGEARNLADPRKTNKKCVARYLREWTAGPSLTLYDESGNANNLTASATANGVMPVPAPSWKTILDVVAGKSRNQTKVFRTASGAVVQLNRQVRMNRLMKIRGGKSRILG